jgi:hypothetical protein
MGNTGDYIPVCSRVGPFAAPGAAYYGVPMVMDSIEASSSRSHTSGSSDVDSLFVGHTRHNTEEESELEEGEIHE